MKRKRSNANRKLNTTLAKKKLQCGDAPVVENDVVREAAANTSSPNLGKSVPDERTRGNVTSLNMENYPNGMREMILSIIKEISKEAGGLGNLSRSVDNNPSSNGQMGKQVDFDNKENVSRHQNPEYKDHELNSALTVIKKTMSLDAADPFNRPVDPVELEIPDYFDVIKTPMDFGTICNNLENGLKYMNCADVFKDVQYIWSNCLKYNKKGDHILKLMNRVRTFFMKHWIAAGLHTEQTTSVIGSGLPHSIPNEEHSESSILRHNKQEKDYQLDLLANNSSNLQPYNADTNHVVENHTMPIDLLSGHSSSEDEDEDEDSPNIDSVAVQKTRQVRGPTRCLKLLTAVGRIKVFTNELGQPIGSEASLLTSFLGLTARDGNLAPLIYPSWSKVPQENKENMWQKVLTKFDINPTSRSWVLKSLGTKWRNFKSLLKTTHFDNHETDEERLADRDERVLPDQWAVLVSQWSSDKWQSISAKNKANRARQKFNHTSGKKSFARIREEEKAKRSDGKEPSRAELFILTRTRKNGQPVNEETAAVISQLRESTTQNEETLVNKNEPEDDAFNRVMGVDKKTLFGLNAAPYRPGTEFPTRAEALRMITEKNAEVLEMKEKLASMEETCAHMASQMSAMVSMMATLQKASAGENVPNAGLVQVNASLQSIPISTSNHDVPARQIRARKNKR